jgi:hypothetical protein
LLKTSLSFDAKGSWLFDKQGIKTGSVATSTPIFEDWTEKLVLAVILSISSMQHMPMGLLQ